MRRDVIVAAYSIQWLDQFNPTNLRMSVFGRHTHEQIQSPILYARIAPVIVPYVTCCPPKENITQMCFDYKLNIFIGKQKRWNDGT